MQPRNLALVGAALGAGFGAVGLIVPGSLAALFGIQLDATATALVRLVCASYVGLGALNWAARDLTDGAAWRVVAVGNATGWAISGVVVATALASGLGNATAWLIVALQFVTTVAWLGVFARSRRSGPDTSNSATRDARP
jgi:hypothetical protein